MSASVIEQILARVKVVLTSTTSAGDNVFRGREDAFGEDECPGLNIRRDDSGHDSLANKRERVIATWYIDHFDVGADWETKVDALHMEVHAKLAADATLATLGSGLRCTGTTCQGDSASLTAGKLTARYQMQTATRTGDLTRRVTS